MSVYVGSNALMISSQQLFKLPFLHYWRAGGFILPVETIGYRMIQQIAGEKIFGVGIDRNTTQTDRLGGRVQWLISPHSPDSAVICCARAAIQLE
jgi:hypothetical protein